MLLRRNGSARLAGVQRRRTLKATEVSVQLLSLILFALSASPVAAQDSTPQPRIWLGFGLGGAWVSEVEESGFGAMVEVVFQYQGHQGLFRSVSVPGYHVDDRSFTEYGLLYGRVATSPKGHAGVSAGISALSVCTGYPATSRIPDDCELTWGIPIAAEIALRLARVLGVGFQAFANVNREARYGGAVLFLQGGWLP